MLLMRTMEKIDLTCGTRDKLLSELAWMRRFVLGKIQPGVLTRDELASSQRNLSLSRLN